MYEIYIDRGGRTGEATASPEFRGFTKEKFLASWIYERGNFSCFTGKKLVPPPLYIDPKLKSLLSCFPSKNFFNASIYYIEMYLTKEGFFWKDTYSRFKSKRLGNMGS